VDCNADLGDVHIDTALLYHAVDHIHIISAHRAEPRRAQCARVFTLRARQCGRVFTLLHISDSLARRLQQKHVENVEKQKNVIKTIRSEMLSNMHSKADITQLTTAWNQKLKGGIKKK